MKMLPLLFVVFLLSACSLQTLHTKTMQTLQEASKHVPLSESPYTNSSSTLYFETSDQNGWDIMQPPEGQWRSRSGIAPLSDQSRRVTRAMYSPGTMNYLPSYFPDRSFDDSGGIGYNNFFYTLYRLDNDEELAMWIHILRTPVLGKRTWRDFWGNVLPKVDEWVNVRYCTGYTEREVMIMINKSDVYFDSSKVGIISKNVYTDNREVINNKYRQDMSYYEIDHNMYYLISPDDIDKEKRIATGFDRPRENRELLYRYSLYRYPPSLHKYSTFAYMLPIACQDLEDAVLVVDGLTYHGEPIPPLKVRMKYYDYSIVPEYTGSVQESMEGKNSWVGEIIAY